MESITESIGPANDPRFREIERLVAEAKPDRVLDLGANQGLYSHMAYQHCDSVISADYDERAVGKHVELLRRTNSDRHIYPIVLNAIQITEEVASRLRSHTVMALALTHHLWIGQQYPISFIAKQFSSLTEKRLITEFMPNGLGGIAGPDPNPLPADYTLENFLDAFRNEFHSVKVIDYKQPESCSPRRLVVCDKHTLRG
jgi:ribosomal protein L11 methylase PrmA